MDTVPTCQIENSAGGRCGGLVGPLKEEECCRHCRQGAGQPCSLAVPWPLNCVSVEGHWKGGRWGAPGLWSRTESRNPQCRVSRFSSPSLGDYLGGEAYWAGGLHLYTPLPFRPGQGGFGELFRTHFFLNAGNLCNLNYGESAPAVSPYGAGWCLP